MLASFRSAFSSIVSFLTARGTRPGKPTYSPDKTTLLIDTGQDIASELFERPELDRFLQQIAEHLEHRFAVIDHVQIYIIGSDSQRVVLCAATGPAGQKLLEREYEVDIGGLSTVGRVTLTKNDLLIQDFNEEKIHKPHPVLSDMRAELAIPLVVKDTVIGALDMQSTQPGAFPQAEVMLLHAIANQITIAVDSLQLHEEAQRNMRDNQALFQQTQSSLREIERLNYLLTGRAWSEYLRLQPDSTALTLDLDTGQTVAEARWTDTLNEAATHRQVITAVKEGQRIVALPITVRNEVIGAMEFELESEEALPEGVLDLAEAVGQRLGMAMENRRLFDETQRAAQREGLINDIGADLQAATGVDVVIQRAAHHLQDVLDARQVSIRLGVPPDSPRREA
jgi:GAF domain-containing protein